MLAKQDSEKIANILIFFVNHTKMCGLTKICKMLYELDFRHFKATGKSVTGFYYKAWENGPVPEELWREIKKEPDKFKPFIKIFNQGKNYVFTPLKKFDDLPFTDRELEIMKNVAFIYKDANSNVAIAATHELRQPWKQTIERKGKNAIIEYELAFDDSPETIPRERYEEMKKHQSLIKKILAN